MPDNKGPESEGGICTAENPCPLEAARWVHPHAYLDPETGLTKCPHCERTFFGFPPSPPPHSNTDRAGEADEKLLEQIRLKAKKSPYETFTVFDMRLALTKLDEAREQIAGYSKHVEALHVELNTEGAKTENLTTQLEAAKQREEKLSNLADWNAGCAEKANEIKNQLQAENQTLKARNEDLDRELNEACERSQQFRDESVTLKDRVEEMERSLAEWKLAAGDALDAMDYAHSEGFEWPKDPITVNMKAVMPELRDGPIEEMADRLNPARMGE